MEEKGKNERKMEEKGKVTGKRTAGIGLMPFSPSALLVS